MVATRRAYAGGAKAGALVSPISAIDSSLLCDALLGWPTGSDGFFAAVIGRGLANEEKVLCSARTSATLTVVQRGYDGTIPQAHGATEAVEHIITATDADEANAHTSSLSGHGIPNGDQIVGMSAVQTLTGKTMDGDENTFVDLPLAASPETLARIQAIEGVNATQSADIDALPTVAEMNTAITDLGTTLVAADANRYTKAESDARYEPLDSAYTKTETDAAITAAVAAHLDALHADTGWVTSTAGFTAAAGFSLQTIKYRVLGKVVYLSATMTRTGADLTNNASGNPTNTALLSAIAAAVTPAEDQGFSSSGDDTTVSSRDITGVVTASGTAVLTAMGGSSDLATSGRVSFSAVYFKD